MSEVLARVTARAIDVPRGADVVHRVRVPQAWLDAGEVIEFELPRNLSCAACAGGGCDVCERSGAITLRGKQELPEILRVTLPNLGGDGAQRGVVMRIPEQGGLPPDDDRFLPRGLLLLRIEAAALADAGVSRVMPERAPSQRRVALSRCFPSLNGRSRRLAFAFVALAVLAALALLAFRHAHGALPG